MRLSAVTVITACVAALFVSALAANAARAAGGDGRRAVLCPQVAQPVIDGRLDDACWQAVGQPDEFDDAATHRLADPLTSMSIGHDDRGIYVALRCGEPRMQSLRPTVTAVDGDVFTEDCGVVVFHTEGERPDSFIEFAANLLATKHDAFDDDHAWNGDWQVAVQRGTDRWTMEIAIPFTDLRAHPDSGDLWGFNVARYRQAAGGEQLFTWSPAADGFWHTETFGYLIFDSLGLNLERQFTKVELRLKAERGDVARLSRTLGRDSRHVREMVIARSAVLGVGRRIKAGVAKAEQWSELRAALAAAEAAYDDALWNLRFEELFAD